MEKLEVTIASRITAEIKAEFLAIVKKSNVTKSEFIRNLIYETLQKEARQNG
jgi:antitoxin component of RelBE/YafQ-DinJ toxin-antitoxin module